MKGQVSIEFFIYFSISLIALAGIFTAAADKQVRTFEYRDITHLESVADKVAFEVENAEAYGPGYSRELPLPREVYGDEYFVEVTNNFVVVESGNESVTSSTRYTGREFSLKSDEGPFEVLNNGSVYIVPG